MEREVLAISNLVYFSIECGGMMLWTFRRCRGESHGVSAEVDEFECHIVLN
jgi:hypothetical protein